MLAEVGWMVFWSCIQESDETTCTTVERPAQLLDQCLPTVSRSGFSNVDRAALSTCQRRQISMT